MELNINELKAKIDQVSLKHQQRNANINLYQKLWSEANSLEEQILNTSEAIKVLATINDKASMDVLNFIQNVINQAIQKLFTNGAYRFAFKRSTIGKAPVINAELFERKSDGTEIALDFNLQTGDGISQIIAFLFTLSLIEIRGIRPLIILDETLKGFHPSAIPTIKDIIKVFTAHGFQIVCVEYDLDELGKIYHAEMKNGTSMLREATDEDLAYDRSIVSQAHDAITDRLATG